MAILIATNKGRERLKIVPENPRPMKFRITVAMLAHDLPSAMAIANNAEIALNKLGYMNQWEIETHEKSHKD